MQYITNYKEWITNDLLRHLEKNTGDCVPVWQPDRWSGHPILENFKNKASKFFKDKTPVFHQFNSNTECMKDFPITLPQLPKTRKNLHWWFVKLLPGEMQTMHLDPHLLDAKNPVRYSIFLQDFIPGHIFTYDHFLATNYKKGDMYEWSDPMIVHGVVNISYIPRYTLQITLHD